MNRIQEPDKVKLFVAILFNPNYTELLNVVLDLLEDKYGQIDYKSKVYHFDMTEYYEQEMGNNLQRMFISFAKLNFPDVLSSFKTFTNQIEEENRINNNRYINLDCGYMDYFKIVLASIKFGGQKIYLNDGIYADITLYYNKGKYEPFFWTFPDFKDQRYNDTLLDIRNIYKKQRKT